ncbi:MAG TPA: hypothetical protein VFT50_09305 [Baekduia sp.]|nr:hypothetical protein [Baekduia sp.]
MSTGINGWTCDACGQTTYVVHVDEGVTPMFLACRAEGVDPREATCKGMGQSLMYPRTAPPPHVLAAVAWEWYQPDAAELRALRQFEPQTAEHVERGGLLLRKLTDAGRASLAALGDSREAIDP